MASLRIALCQLDVTVGDLEGNAEKVIAQLAEAEAAGADLAVFPELVLTGYPPGGPPAWSRASSRGTCSPSRRWPPLPSAARRWSVSSRRTATSTTPPRSVRRAGARRSSASRLLPNYGVFDERRYFAPGEQPDQLFLVAGVRVGVTICEDAWSPSGPVGRLGEGGAELVVTLNASPYRAGILAQRERMLATRAADASAALCYVNLVGGQDELVFDGASMVFDHDGELVASAPQFAEALVHLRPRDPPGVPQAALGPAGPRSHVGPAARDDLRACRVRRPRPLPARRPRARRRWRPASGRVAEVYEALVLGTSDYVRKNDFTDVLGRACPAASTPRSSPRSPPTPSVPSACTAC